MLGSACGLNAEHGEVDVESCFGLRASLERLDRSTRPIESASKGESEDKITSRDVFAGRLSSKSQRVKPPLGCTVTRSSGMDEFSTRRWNCDMEARVSQSPHVETRKGCSSDSNAPGSASRRFPQQYSTEQPADSPPPPEDDEAFEGSGRSTGTTQRSAEARPSAGRQTFPFTLRSEGARERPSELSCKASILKLKDFEPPTGICALLFVFTTRRGAPSTPAETKITPSTVPASNRSFGSVHATNH
jgi:hypothetical protein